MIIAPVSAIFELDVGAKTDRRDLQIKLHV